jgi:hypothetical protein
MPSFNTDANIEVDVEEFMDGCNSYEIDEVIEYLIDNGRIDGDRKEPSNSSINQTEFQDNLKYLSQNYHGLTTEEENEIKKISKRFRY